MRFAGPAGNRRCHDCPPSCLPVSTNNSQVSTQRHFCSPEYVEPPQHVARTKEPIYLHIVPSTSYSYIITSFAPHMPHETPNHRLSSPDTFRVSASPPSPTSAAPVFCFHELNPPLSGHPPRAYSVGLMLHRGTIRKRCWAWRMSSQEGSLLLVQNRLNPLALPATLATL